MRTASTPPRWPWPRSPDAGGGTAAAGAPAPRRAARGADADGVHPPARAVAPLCGSRESTCQGRSTATLLSAGTHYLWLDRHVQYIESSEYVRRGELTAPVPVDACAQARPLVFSNGAQGG